MAVYKDGTYFSQSNSSEFDVTYAPGDTPNYSGIFRCMGCNKEVVAEASRKLPPQNHHQHTANQGNIVWKLIARPQ